MTSGAHIVRVRHGSVNVPGASPPYDTAHFRLFHPALLTGSDIERLTGMLPPDPALAPWPLVVVMPGINVSPDGYRWLAERLAEAGFATLTYTFVADVMGMIGISPGLDLSAIGPDSYGTRPSATALGPLLAAVRTLAAGAPFDGLIDLDRVVLFGHSAGGTVALENANPAWFPGVCAVATYGAHTMPAQGFGHPDGTVLAVPADVPVLLMAGSADGVIARSMDRYGATDAAAHDPVRRTFVEGIWGVDSFHVVFDGATHLACLDPLDHTTARGFLDPPSDADPAAREVLGQLVVAFCAAVTGHGSFEAIDALLADPVISSAERR